MLEIESAERSYRHDAMYKRFVDSLVCMLEGLHMTPAEVRGAAVYAAYLFELRHPKPIFIPKEDWDLYVRMMQQEQHLQSPALEPGLEEPEDARDAGAIDQGV